MAIVLIRFVPVALSRRWPIAREARPQDEDERCPITNTCDTVRPSRRDVRAAQSPAVIRHGLVFPPRRAVRERPSFSTVLSFFPFFLSSFPPLFAAFCRRRRQAKRSEAKPSRAKPAAAFRERVLARMQRPRTRRRMPFSFRLHSRSSFDRDAS